MSFASAHSSVSSTIYKINMKNIIIPILLLLCQLAHAELFTGDFTLITSKDVGAHGIAFREGIIEEENGTKYLVMPRLGRAEIISNKAGTDFHAIYMPREVEHEGKMFESFSIIVASIRLEDDGGIFFSLNTTRSVYSRDYTQYILKQGKLK
jgi:hypothetical protein